MTVAQYRNFPLGPLAKDGPTAAEHRVALLSYLETGQSLIRTAEEQHVHRNTIVYRMHRIEEMLPALLSEQRLQIHLALRLAVQYGAKALYRPQAR